MQNGALKRICSKTQQETSDSEERMQSVKCILQHGGNKSLLDRVQPQIHNDCINSTT